MKIRNIIVSVIGIGFAVVFSGCPSHRFEHAKGHFSNVPTNFTDVNSVYDDYNSALPIIWHNQYLCFSSNRKSAGQNFDIIGDNLNIVWDMETGVLTVDSSNPHYDISYIDSLQNMINTPANEFGPLAVNYWTAKNDGSGQSVKYDLFSYSSNYDSDDYNSKFVYYKSDGFGNGDGTYHGPISIKLINSMQNAQYISFLNNNTNLPPYGEPIPSSFTNVIFNADTGGITNIYSAELPANEDFINMLGSDTVLSPKLITELSSQYNDKCPFVNDHIIVFASNRPGGYGGYDLYYSKFVNGEWLEPINFGAEINSSYDEFRPVTIQVIDFDNDLMIFSSNRPGGKGGFDLYYVGLPTKINQNVFVE